MSSTLEDLLSRDAQRIWQASWEVIASRDTALLEELRAALPRIREATAGIELGGLITPNRRSLQHALAKVSGYRSWTCWCDDYPRLLQFDPNREQERGHVRIVSEDGSYWPGSFVVECAECGRGFSVQGGEHHSVWWKWTGRRGSGDAPARRAREV